MSSGHRQDSTSTRDITNLSITSDLVLPLSDSPSPDDESLREENTLSACLLRILHSGHTFETEDHPSNQLTQADQRELDRLTDYRVTHPLSPHNQVDCRRLNLPHCQRARTTVPRSPTSDYSLCSNLFTTKENMAEKEVGGEGEKLKSWRAAGEALRKVLAETGAVHGGKQREGEGRSKRECLKVARGLCKRKEGGELSGGEASLLSDDPMNVMLDEYKAQKSDCTNDALNPKVTQSLLAGVESVIANSENPPAESNHTNLTPGLATVRERIQQITAKINHNRTTDGAADGASRKGHPHKYNRTTGLLHTRSSSIGHGSSSESEDEVETKRHKMFVPRCRRASSSGKLPKTAAGPEASEQLTEDGRAKDKAASENMLQSTTSQDKNSPKPARAAVDPSSNTVELLSDIDSQEDLVTHKLQQLARKHDNNCISESDDPSLHQFRPYTSRGCGHLLSAETDSITNLADIESSLHSDENETLGESDLSEVRFTDKRLIGGRDVDSGREDEADSGSACPGWGSDADGNWSEQGTLKRNKEKAKSQAEKSRGEAKPTGAGSEGEELEDIEDYVFDESSPSDHDNAAIKIPADKLGNLPDLVSDSSAASASDGDGEADDEFECDCPVCQQHKTRTEETEWVTDDEDDILGAVDRIEYYSNNSNQHPHAINLAELTPLDLLLMREGRRELLELMFQNVIMQMLSVYPDLLGEQAPPPAPPTTINDLPRIKVTSTHVGEDLVCPICLCNLEVGEEARELPCHHKFHGLCIQAWLHKSGTCPVCRHILSGPS